MLESFEIGLEPAAWFPWDTVDTPYLHKDEAEKTFWCF